MASSKGEFGGRELSEYAKSADVSLSAAVEQLEIQDAIGALSARLRLEEVRTFGGLFVEHWPTYAVVVQFTEDGARTMAKYQDDLPSWAPVRVDQVRYSLAELEAEQVALEQLISGTTAAVDLSVKRNRVELQVTDNQSAPEYDASLFPSATVVTGAEPRLPATDIFAGLQLGGGACTSGFTVYYGTNTSNRGVTTAGHCPNTLTFGSATLIYQGDDHHSGDYDVQSHKLSGGTYLNKAKDDDATPRAITARSYWVNQNVGDFVCKYGRTTGFGCGYIVSDHDPGCVGGGSMYIKVDSDPNGTGYDLSESGDSGGPWYSGGTAKGLMSCQAGNDGIYSTTGFVESPIGAHILITS